MVQRRAAFTGEGIEQHTFTERVVGHDHLADVEVLHRLFEDQRAGEQDVGAARVDAGQPPPIVDGGRVDQLLHHSPDLTAGEGEVVEGPRLVTLVARRLHHGGDGLDRAATTDCDVEPARAHLATHPSQHGAHVASTSIDGTRVKQVGAKEAAGQTDGPELQTERGERFASLTHQYLGAPTADVDEHEPLVEDGYGLEHAEMDQPCFLDTADDVDVDARFAARSFDEHVGVLGLANRTGRDGIDLRPRLISAIFRNRSRVSMPRSMASGSSSFMSPEPEPSRTISFSRAITSKLVPSPNRATTRWIEFVPMSIAARCSLLMFASQFVEGGATARSASWGENSSIITNRSFARSSPQPTRTRTRHVRACDLASERD